MTVIAPPVDPAENRPERRPASNAATPTRRRTSVVALVVALALVLAAEGAVRVAAPALRPPLRWHNWEAQNKVAQMDRFASTGARASVAFVGSSMVNAAVDPVQLTRAAGLKRPAYNAALNAAAGRTLERWALDVVLPKLRPQVLVIGVSSRELNDGGVVQSREFDKFVDAPAAKATLANESWLDRLEGRMDEWSYVVRYRAELRRPMDARDAIPRAERGEIGALGTVKELRIFAKAPYRNNADFVHRMVTDVLANYAVGGRELDAVRRLITEASKRGVRVALVQMPLTDDAIRMHPHGAADYARFEQTLRSLARQTNAPLVDLTDQYRDHALFFDALHLNGQGRSRFTADVMRELRTRGLLPAA